MGPACSCIIHITRGNMSPSLLPLFYESFSSLQTGYFQPLSQFFTALGFWGEIRRRHPPCFLRRSTLLEIHQPKLFSEDYFSSSIIASATRIISNRDGNVTNRKKQRRQTDRRRILDPFPRDHLLPPWGRKSWPN